MSIDVRSVLRHQAPCAGPLGVAIAIGLLVIGSIGFAPSAALADQPQCLQGSMPPTLVPDGPGACFGPASDHASIGARQLGFVFFFNVHGENDFLRLNPDGTLFLHNDDDDVPLVFCPADVVTNGLCVPGSSYIFIGAGQVSGDGVLSNFGPVLCPFVARVRGEVVRTATNETLQIDTVLHLVPDSNGSCRLQRLQVLKAGPSLP